MLYELRTYQANPNRMAELQARFRDHFVRLFRKHGITPVGFWSNTIGARTDQLIYLLAYEDMGHRERTFKTYGADPELLSVVGQGILSDWNEARFLAPTDFSPPDHGGDSETPRVFEMRSYIANAGKMPALLERFRDHAVSKFAEHGMTGVGYWTNVVGGRNDELLYMLAYPSMEARETSWAAFGADEEWRAARAASEVDGPLLQYATNRFLAPTDFSPLQ